MSANVGVLFVVYHGRSLSTCEPSRPATAYHRTVRLWTNHAIGWARSTLPALHTWGSCRPSSCLLSKNATSTLQRRQYPAITNSAEASELVASNASSRH